MTLESQRIAIAEACGWRQSTYAKEGRVGLGDYEVWVSPQGRVFDRYVEQGLEKENTYLPDYLNDLNAMHEAEKVLTTGEQCYRFVKELALLTGALGSAYSEGPHGISVHVPFLLAHATAAQRAEAFLRTLGLWKD